MTDELEKYPAEKFLDRYEDRKQKRDLFAKFHYNKTYSFVSLWCQFFMFSIAGWIWEGAYHWFSRGELVNRGSMHGPWVPIYGISIVLIVALLHKIADKPLIVFLLIMLISAIVEYFTSYYFEVFRGIRFWDYTNDFMNLHGRIYLEGIIFFGIGGCGAFYLIAPILDALQSRFNKKIKMIVLVILTLVFIADMVYSYNVPNTANGVVYVDVNPPFC